jgi:hypothetical protein
MARCGAVRTDYPFKLLTEEPFTVDPIVVELASVSTAEQARIQAASEAFRTGIHAEIKSIARALLPPQHDEAPDMRALLQALRAAQVPTEVTAVRRELARARAGLERARPPRTPSERLEHLMADVGDRYETLLAQELGPARAAELRAVQDGWGARIVAMGSCEEPSPSGP